MSRGEGQLQRRIVRLVEKAVQRGDGPLTRRELEDRLSPEGYRSDNILRSLRGLSRAGLLEYREARFPSNCLIRPPTPFVPFTDEAIMAMLSEPGWKPSPGTDAPAHRTHTQPRGVGEKNPRVYEAGAEPWVEASPAIERAAWAPGEGGDAV